MNFRREKLHTAFEPPPQLNVKFLGACTFVHSLIAEGDVQVLALAGESWFAGAVQFSLPPEVVPLAGRKQEEATDAVLTESQFSISPFLVDSSLIVFCNDHQ